MNGLANQTVERMAAPPQRLEFGSHGGAAIGELNVRWKKGWFQSGANTESGCVRHHR
jgi:hypothetical protein